MKLFNDLIDSEKFMKQISDKLNEARFMKPQNGGSKCQNVI